jgi:hypothetical protein
MLPRRFVKIVIVLALLASGVVSQTQVSAASNKYLTAWGRLTLDGIGMEGLVQYAEGITLRLSSIDDNSYDSSLNIERILTVLRDTNEFSFTRVPVDKAMQFELCYTNTWKDGESDCYRATFVFEYPKLNVLQSLQRKKAERIAGYVGDFTIDTIGTKITEEDGTPY